MIKLVRAAIGISLTFGLALSLLAEARSEPTHGSGRPKVGYPAEAKRAGLEGHGIVAMQVNEKTGAVMAVWMAKSTGRAILDREVIRAFRTARVHPGSRSPVTVPVTFTIPKRKL